MKAEEEAEVNADALEEEEAEEMAYAEGADNTHCECVGGSDKCIIKRNNVIYKRGDFIYTSSKSFGDPHSLSQLIEPHAKLARLGMMRVRWFTRLRELPDDSSQHQLQYLSHPLLIKHQDRQVYVCKAEEIIPMTLLRGKCTIIPAEEVEHLSSRELAELLEKPDTFISHILFDPLQRNKFDRHIRVGPNNQAELPSHTPGHVCSLRETKVWDCYQFGGDDALGDYLASAQALEATVRQAAFPFITPDDAVVAASRDTHLQRALDVYAKSGYQSGEALSRLLESPLHPDALESWEAEDRTFFLKGLRMHGKQFTKIHEKFLPHKSVREIIEYYYQWKTTHSYTQYRRTKRGRYHLRRALDRVLSQKGYSTDDSAVDDLGYSFHRKQKRQKMICDNCHVRNLDLEEWHRGPEKKILCKTCRK